MGIFRPNKKTSTRPVQPIPTPDAMPFARSPLLRALPVYHTVGRTGRIVRRLIFWVSLISGSVWLFHAVHTKALGDGFIAAIFYRLHDDVFLTVKGYTYTLFFPSSLIWYGLAGTVLGLWLGFFVADRSLVRRPHLKLLRLFVRFRLMRWLLLATSRLLKRRGFPPDQLLLVAEHERDAAIRQVAIEQSGVGARRQLVHLTQLITQLRLLYSGRRPALEAAVDWQRALLLLRFCGAKREAAKLADADVVRPIIERVVGPIGLHPLATLQKEDKTLDVECTVADLLRQAALAGLNMAALSNSNMVTVSGIQPIHELIRAAEWRRRTINQIRGHMELALFQRGTGRTGLPPIAPEAAEDELPFLGALALRCALAAAHEARSANIAVGAVEAVEALNLAIACLPGTFNQSDLAETAHRARLWVGDLPTPQDYQMAASLAAAEAVTAEHPWRAYLDETNPVIRRADTALAFARADELFQAGGDAFGANLLDTTEDGA